MVCPTIGAYYLHYCTTTALRAVTCCIARDIIWSKVIFSKGGSYALCCEPGRICELTQFYANLTPEKSFRLGRPEFDE
jgi:hypothetical protein